MLDELAESDLRVASWGLALTTIVGCGSRGVSARAAKVALSGMRRVELGSNSLGTSRLIIHHHVRACKRNIGQP